MVRAGPKLVRNAINNSRTIVCSVWVTNMYTTAQSRVISLVSRFKGVLKVGLGLTNFQLLKIFYKFLVQVFKKDRSVRASP